MGNPIKTNENNVAYADAIPINKELGTTIMLMMAKTVLIIPAVFLLKPTWDNNSVRRKATKQIRATLTNVARGDSCIPKVPVISCAVSINESNTSFTASKEGRSSKNIKNQLIFATFIKSYYSVMVFKDC